MLLPVRVDPLDAADGDARSVPLATSIAAKSATTNPALNLVTCPIETPVSPDDAVIVGGGLAVRC
jgi:hypothetical protein